MEPFSQTIEEIQNALTRLLARPSGAFLIIEESKTGRFVQFAGSIEKPLHFDLPEQALSPAEFTKTESLFKEAGLPGPETYELQKYPGGPPAGTQTSFSVTFGNNTKNAAILAVGIFNLIYKIDDLSNLVFTEE